MGSEILIPRVECTKLRERRKSFVSIYEEPDRYSGEDYGDVNDHIEADDEAIDFPNNC